MFNLEFSTDNAAFMGGDGAEEVAIILERIAISVRLMATEGVCRDSNGNRVGEWSYTQEEEE